MPISPTRSSKRSVNTPKARVVEELTKAVLESADHDNCGDRSGAAACPGGPGNPARLANCAARSSRPSRKEVAQIGVVIGCEFTYALITAVAAHGRELELAFHRLTNGGLLFCRGVPPHSSYLFKQRSCRCRLPHDGFSSRAASF